MRLRQVSSVALCVFMMCQLCSAQHIPGYNYDESKIAPYQLLDPLRMSNGTPVVTAVQWFSKRRPQIMRLFEDNVFGRTPDAAKNVLMHARVIEHDDHALDALAIREQIELTFDPAPGITPAPEVQRTLRLLLYVPANAKHRPAPVVLGLNFTGNQSVLDDPAILSTPIWSKPSGTTALVHVLPSEKTRGSATSEWQVKFLLSRGYGIATAYYQELEPDFKNASQYSVRNLFQPASLAPKSDDWGAIGAWAWGLSRAMDYLQRDPLVDGAHVAVTGHSRLGKAADWAAAQDSRFAALLSTESGHGGQSIQRRALGETVAHLEHSFPEWFCPAYAQWVGRDAEIAADGNLLLSLNAPRPLYVASAVEDEWSDPKGEFLSAQSASRVYEMLGEPALLPDAQMPAIDQAIGLTSDVAYHVRAGLHDVTLFDWEHYLDFLDDHWGRPATWPTVPPAGKAPPAPAVHPASAATVLGWRTELRRTLYIPEPLPAVQTERYSSNEITPGITLERVTYVTAYGLRVPANIYRPTHSSVKRMPAIVIVNGHGADKSSWYSYYSGVLYAKAGAVVLTYDPIGEGERNDEHKDFTGEHDQLVLSPSDMPVRLGGLMVTDVMQAVSELAARSDVDPHRIGVLGFSMGSFIASLAGAADPRIHALLLDGGGDLDGVGGYWDEGHAIMCQAAAYKALRVLGDRGAVLFTLNAKRGNTLILNGTDDSVVDIPNHGPAFFDDLRVRVTALNGSDRGVFTTWFDPGASHRPSWMTAGAAEWLNGELHFPAWRSTNISQLPSITIGDWAQGVGLPLEKSSGRKDRDAGIVALKAGVPLLTAAQLDVLPQAEWEKQKEEFVYATWLKRAAHKL